MRALLPSPLPNQRIRRWSWLPSSIGCYHEVVIAADSRILIVRLSALGDVVHVLPALDALRSSFPRAHIGWLVERPASSLLANHAHIDRLWVWPRRRIVDALMRKRNPVSAATAAGRFLRDLRRARYDVVLDFHANLRSGLLTRASGAKQRVGFSPTVAKELSHLFTNQHVSPTADKPHKVERALALAAAVGANIEGARARLVVEPAAKDKLAPFLADLHGRRCIGVHGGVSTFGAIKSWPHERFAVVLRAVYDRHGVLSVISWGPGEREGAQKLVEACDGAAALAADTHSLHELAALYEGMDLVMGCDTGPIHLAAALGRPVLALFGPKDPAIYAPWSSRTCRPVATVWEHVGCSPCTRRRCSHVSCMRAITAPRVIAALEAQLSLPKTNL